MEQAKLVASKSKDESMKVGCVLVNQNNTVTSTGYNGFPRGVDEDDDPDRQKRPEKYLWTEHAERNAVYNAALNGVKTQYGKAFATAHPCVECARALIQAGIIELYIPTKHSDPFYKMGRWVDWEESLEKALEILSAAGVKVTHVI
jgi:dCMP deaminase